MIETESLPAEDTSLLREYLSIAWGRRYSIFALTIIAAAAAGLYARAQTPMYTSSVNVLATNPLSTIDQTGSGQNSVDMQSERSLVTSLPVLQCATQILLHPTDNNLSANITKTCASATLAKTTPLQNLKKNVTVVVQPDSTILTISYSDRHRIRAQEVAQAFALAYVQFKTSEANAVLARRREPIAARLAVVNRQLAAANTALAQHAAAAAAAGTNCLACPGDVQKISSYTQEAGTLNQELLDISSTRVVGPRVLAPASLPTTPSSPNKLLDVGLGLFVGLMLGIGVAFLREWLDDRVRGRIDLGRAARAPVLAMVPRLGRWWRHDSTLVTLTDPRGVGAESYRALRAAVLFASVHRGVKSILVASSTGSEGSTTTAANLAVALATANRRVILVSGDLRKPRLHRLFRIDNGAGLSSVLSGEASPWELLQRTDVDNLRVLTSGPSSARPGELLQSAQMAELVARLREVSDFVIIDTAPILPTADAGAISAGVDGVLIVAAAGRTPTSAIVEARDQLDQVGAPVLGAVLNWFEASKARAYRTRPYAYQYSLFQPSHQLGPAPNGQSREHRPAESLPPVEGAPSDSTVAE